MTEKILAIAKEIEPRLIQIRRDIHSHPELGLQEERTAKLVADTLEELGLEVKRNFFATGVVGLLKGGKPGKTLLIRADMDALPV
ncbi:MAG TPA: amidohydrolase, partial [Firmicutes bacterium]|nr:amidohydrolase [Bacillota bacterium]